MERHQLRVPLGRGGGTGPGHSAGFVECGRPVRVVMMPIMRGLTATMMIIRFASITGQGTDVDGVPGVVKQMGGTAGADPKQLGRWR